MQISYMAIPGIQQYTPKGIIKAACKVFGADENRIYTKTREREIVEAIQAIMYFYKDTTDKTLTAIGLMFKKDHATVSYAIKKCKQSEVYNKEFNVKLNRFLKKVK